jgi:hypothetical protein
MEDVGKEIREALGDKDKEALEAATHPDREVAALHSTPGYNRVCQVVNRYYLGAAEKNLAEGGERNEYWVGVRAGITLFLTLVGDSVTRLQEVDEMNAAAGEDEDLEPGADFLPALGGSTL